MIIGAYSYEGGTVDGGFFVSGGDESVRAPEAYWGEEGAVKEQISAQTQQEEQITVALTKNAEELTKADENLKTLRAKTQEAVLALNSVQNERANKERELKTIQ